MYRSRYFKDEYFAALDIVKPAADKHGLTMVEVALRWMTHRSQLGKKFPDAILIGASRSVLGAEDHSTKYCAGAWNSTKHIEQNLKDLEKGPLAEDVVRALTRVGRRSDL